MKIQKKQKTWIDESIEKMGEKPEDFACEDIECEEKKREEAEKAMNKRLEPAKKVAEKTKEEDHVEEGKPFKEEVENITSYDVKDRKELASLLEEKNLTTKDVSIKRSVKEGCRYNVTLKNVINETKEEIKEESTQETIVEEKESLEESKEPIDKEALEFYVNNWHEGDNITVTSDLLNVLEQSLDMIKQYGSKEECLHEDANQHLVGRKVIYKDEETSIKGVDKDEDDITFELENGKVVSPIDAFKSGTLTSEDEEVIKFIELHTKVEEPKKELEKPKEAHKDWAASATDDFYKKDRSYYKNLVRQLKKGGVLSDDEKQYYDAYYQLEKSPSARKKRGLDVTINSTYKGDVEELIDWLRNDGISSINVVSNEDDFDRTQEFIDELNKRDNTSYELKTTNKQGDSYVITLTTKKDILDKMPEEIKTWMAPKNSGKFGSTAEKVDANVFSERDHTLTSNGIVKDLLLNYDFHLGDYKEKKESLDESTASDKKKLKYLLDKEECCPLDKQERYELQELLNKYGYPEDLEESQKGFVTFLNLELGVLNDDSDEFEYYSSAYDHKHGYYDETYLNGLEKDFNSLKEDALNYIKNGVTNTYAILTSIDVQGSEDDDYIRYAIQQIEEDGFIDESVDFLDGEQFDVDNVIWSAYKDEEGNIHENFVDKEEDVKEEVLDEMAKLPYGVLAWKLNDIISSMNHEGAYLDSGWLYTWPDGETREDCMVDFNDKESYDELKELFEEVYKRYHKAGLYTNDQSLVDYAHKIDAKLGLEPIQNFGKINDKHIGDDPYDESLEEEDKETLNEGRYSDLEHKLAEKENELKELKIKLQNAIDDESKENIEASIDICQNDIANIQSELAEIRYIDNGPGYNYDYEESLKESKEEQTNEEEIDDDFLSDENDLIDDEDVDDDFGSMSFDDKMDFLAKDEQEAIDGYDEVIDTIEDEHVKDQLKHIKGEEVAHKEFLDVVKEDPSVSYEDFEHEEEDEEDSDDDFGVYESLSDNELVTSLVANGSCGDEKEAQERVARMSKEEKDELSKSIKRQAMVNLIGD